jgi:hypothetical protein
VYDMYPAWDKPAASQDGSQTASQDASVVASPQNGARQARVEHIRTPRRRVTRPGTSPALKAVQASLDRRDNGGDANGAASGTTGSGATLNGVVATRATSGATRQ